MFKNRQAGITTLTIDSLDEQAIRATLEKCTGKAPKDFFLGMPFVADLQQAEIDNPATLLELKQLFHAYSLTLIGLTNHRCTSAALSDAGLADIQLSQNQPNQNQGNERKSAGNNASATAPASAPTAETPTLGAKVVAQHVRSGQRLYARGRDLVIIGTVGAGAEIIADGNISVYGSLRGRAFAGARGNAECFIYCSDMAAELLSIAGCYQNMEQLDIYKGQRDCLATLDDETRMHIRSLLKPTEH